MAAAAVIMGTLSDVRKLDVVDELPTYTESKSYLSDDLVVAPMPKKGKGGAVTGASGMPSFTILKGKAAALDLQNIDTDMIIPKQFLKTVKRTGLGISAFYEMRYDQNGKERGDFVLNKDGYRNSEIFGDELGLEDLLITITTEYEKLLINAPFPCKIVSLNGDVEDNPDLVNDDAYADGWCLIVQPFDYDADQYLDENEYIEYLNEL